MIGSKRIDEAPLGRVQLSLEYNDENGDLIVVLHQVRRNSNRSIKTIQYIQIH